MWEEKKEHRRLDVLLGDGSDVRGLFRRDRDTETSFYGVVPSGADPNRRIVAGITRARSTEAIKRPAACFNSSKQ
ncbi:hypothetical protein KQX54_002135 [Cotesia glomerata]|uniref:Uncharacterized protein n=1 Tax=Cotesia glomerata TaxID=32391 RepID=A0AAV7J258_COTGL|nr:hypothetical protein KQX54_002135 [Cotesia glomerata]